VVVDVVLAILAWRDLSRRSENEVRGSKRFWRLAVMANPGNSVAYWLIGRKRGD
jgi:hypothetical protein